MFSQIINKGPEARKYTSVEPQQESKTSVNKRDNSAKKNLQCYKMLQIMNLTQMMVAYLVPKCYYTDVIDLRNQSNENGEHILQQISTTNQNQLLPIM